jgi:hypothetical protein
MKGLAFGGRTHADAFLSLAVSNRSLEMNRIRSISMRTIGAYHVATFPGWEPLVREQCARIHDSGLYHSTHRILVGIVGDAVSGGRLVQGLLGEKAEVHDGGPLSSYEFPTLTLLHHAAMREEFYGWYIHTKGVSSGSDGAAIHRRQMESVILDNYRACRELLDDYDACGAEWRIMGFNEPHPHFGGNFWWARSDYLATLPPPCSLDQTNRYEAEFWIGKNSAIRPFELVYPTDPYDRPSAWRGLEPLYRQLCDIHHPREIRCIVDIGVDYGHTTFQFAEDFPHADVYGVSDFRLHADSETWVRSHLAQFPNIRLKKGNSAIVAADFKQPVDLVHIDGDHDYASVRRDFESWLPWLQPGSRVLFHDTETFAGVRQFFDELPGKKTGIAAHHGLGCWFFQEISAEQAA